MSYDEWSLWHQLVFFYRFFSIATELIIQSSKEETHMKIDYKFTCTD